MIQLFLFTPCLTLAQPVETEIPGVTAEFLELRLSGDVLRLAVRFTNSGTSDASLSYPPSQIVLVDVKSKRKYLPMKTADNRHIAPHVDPVDGYMRLSIPAGKSKVIWTYFAPLAAGTVLNLELPKMFPIENVTVTEAPTKVFGGTTAKSNPDGVVATIVSARRADQVLSVRLRLTPEEGAKIALGSYFLYRDVFLFDPAGKRLYPLLKDTTGNWQAQPAANWNIGGFLASWNATTLMTLNFPAPPDSVKTVDLILPYFVPFEGVAIQGLGGSTEGGVAAAGETLGIEGALKDLGAKVTDAEIRIDLAADVLFDFDKATLKKEAEPSLQKLATVLKAHPAAKTTIEGHTDGKGTDAYNQTLSEQRAQSVKQFLVGAGAAAANITARGMGETKPVAHNTKPDGSDDPEGRAKNRRVEIVVRTGA
ncbi:MAG TPA: OmpA family protein [Gemmatimonadota bacterium]|nr:OmpA family protein [Gemmatimonadota bacterium]